MIQSMTGYGKSVLQLPTKKVTIEIKSLNSKNLDLNVRIPSYYREKELEVRKELAASLVRGKVDFSIYVEMTADETSTTVNKGVVSEYIKQLRNVVQTGSSDDVELLKMAVRMPDALKTEREELDDEEWNTIHQHIKIAIKEIIQYRIDEAASLEDDFKQRIENIQKFLEDVKALDGDRIEHVKQRLQKAINELKVEVDENRFEQELIYYLEKLDINEEKVRLANHLDYFLSQLATSDSNGKKLGFIVQEIGREINTIGSKANFAPMQKDVIQMKNELEKIKSFSLNKKNLELDEIKSIINFSGEYKSDSLVNECLSGNIPQYKKILSELYTNTINHIFLLKILSSKIRRLLSLKMSEQNYNSLDSLINASKPPIFWKEKTIVKKQLTVWNLNELKTTIHEINDIELLCKKKPIISKIVFFNFFNKLCKKANNYS